MNTVWIAAAFVGAIVSLEILVRVVVTHYRKEFQWLITASRDEKPEFEPELIKKYLAKSFDPELGFTRRPNSSGTEKGSTGMVEYHIDESGSRSLPNCTYAETLIASFGDSYTFCRQVSDAETWQSELSQRSSTRVLNFGVGNYGLDQALLRYQATQLPASTEIVVMGVVPETLCRVHAYWKHYSEFGNTLAFKPRFVLTADGLELCKSPVRSEAEFYNFHSRLADIRRYDGFYHRKFRSYLFYGSYLISFVRHPLRNFRLLGLLLRRTLCRRLGCSDETIENAPFAVVMAANLALSDRMYREPENTALLTAIALRFKEEAQKRGHIPVLLVMPQLMDLVRAEKGHASYRDFFEGLAQELDVLDVTPDLMSGDYRKYYVEDSFGGHFSARGNRLIGRLLHEHLRRHYSDAIS